MVAAASATTPQLTIPPTELASLVPVRAIAYLTPRLIPLPPPRVGLMFAIALGLLRRRLYSMLLMLAWKIGRWAFSRRMGRAFNL